MTVADRLNSIAEDLDNFTPGMNYMSEREINGYRAEAAFLRRLVGLHPTVFDAEIDEYTATGKDANDASRVLHSDVPPQEQTVRYVYHWRKANDND